LHEFTHDSFYVGEDGPTHQPIEHAMSLRSIPNFNVYRPADANETAVCFKLSLKDKTTPSALLLTRQAVPVIEHDFESLEYSVSKGGYIVQNCESKPEIIFIATGSEVSLAIESAKLFPDRKTRVISMPCLELFEEQSKEYKEELLPERGCLKVSLEAGITQGWHKYTGPTGLNIGLDHYGSSAPGNVLAEKFGFTPLDVYEKINAHLKKLL
jgi:transketolase